MCVECCKSEVPPLASGPILCLLGAMMCSSVKGVDWDDFQESVRACRARYRFYRCSMWYEEDPINASRGTCAKLVHSTEIYSVLKTSQV